MAIISFYLMFFLFYVCFEMVYSPPSILLVIVFCLFLSLFLIYFIGFMTFILCVN